MIIIILQPPSVVAKKCHRTCTLLFRLLYNFEKFLIFNFFTLETDTKTSLHIK